MIYSWDGNWTQSPKRNCSKNNRFQQIVHKASSELTSCCSEFYPLRQRTPSIQTQEVNCGLNASQVISEKEKKFSTVSHQHARLPPKCLVFVQNVGWERFRSFLSLNRERLHLLAVSLRWKSYSSWKELNINAWKLAKMKKSSLNLAVQKKFIIFFKTRGCWVRFAMTSIKKLKDSYISPSRTSFCF